MFQPYSFADDMNNFCNIVHVQIFTEKENWEIEIESNSGFPLQINVHTHQQRAY